MPSFAPNMVARSKRFVLCGVVSCCQQLSRKVTTLAVEASGDSILPAIKRAIRSEPNKHKRRACLAVKDAATGAGANGKSVRNTICPGCAKALRLGRDAGLADKAVSK